MTALEWDRTGERQYETGVDHVALFVMDETGTTYGAGVAWNGVTAITESPSGAESTAQYADNIKYLNLVSAEEFGATLEAFMYPDEFYPCDGVKKLTNGTYISGQTRRTFALAYRTLVGNDTQGTDHGYKIHVVYGLTATPSEKANNTVNDSPEASTFSWELSSTPVNVAGHKPTSHVWVSSLDHTDDGVMAKLEAKLFGDTSNEPTLVMPDELDALLTAGE